MSPRRAISCCASLLLLLSIGESHARIPSASRRILADSLYDQAIRDTVGRGPRDRIRLFQKVLKAHYGHAPAHHQIARCLMEQGTVGSRMSAEYELQEALRVDPDNVRYHLTYADLLWRKGMLHDAKERYERALRIDPNCAEAASGAARYHLFDMFRYQDMQAVVADTEEPQEIRALRNSGLRNERNPGSLAERDFYVLSLREFGLRDRDRARSFLARALKADPDHKTSLARLCLVHYEDQKPDSLLAVTDRYLERHPDDAEVLLYRGLGFQTMRRFPQAAEAYEKSLRFMTAPEREALESLAALISPEARDRTPRVPRLASAGPDTAGLPDFWGRRDPLLLTSYNERRMEHYGRVAYANMRFGRPEEGIPGWKTEQGQVYIRYGRYLGRVILRPMAAGQVYHETWSYEGFNVTFQNWDGLDHWRFESYRSPAYPGPVSDSGDLYKRFPERYLDPYQDREFGLPNQVAAFRGQGGTTRIEVSWALPVDEFRYRRVGSRYAADVTSGAFLLDSTGVGLSREVVRNAAPRPAIPGPRGGVYFFEEKKWTALAGRYGVVVEAQDQASGRVGRLRRELDTRWLQGPGLRISDILLASDIRRAGEEESSRTGFAVTPNPLRTYRSSEDLAVYFEVYGLTVDPNRRTAYEVSYTLGSPQDREVDLSLFPDLGSLPKGAARAKTPVRSVVYRPGIDTWSGAFDFLRSPAEDGSVVEYRVEYQADPGEAPRMTRDLQRELGLKGKQASTTVTLRYEGDRAEEPRTLRIDVRNTPPGLRKLTLTVTDLHAKTRASAWTLVRIVE